MYSKNKLAHATQTSGIKKFLLPLLILFVFPIGLIAMWKWTLWNRYLKIALTLLIVFFVRQIIVLYLIFYGFILYPEASRILYHYCFSDGSELVLKNNYLKRSPVILYHIQNMNVGEKRRVGMHQWEDMRLTYGFNPFNIEKYKEYVIINYYIDFTRKSDVITMIGPIPIPDCIVHGFNCTPFLAKTKILNNEIDYKDVDSPNLIESYFLKTHKKCKRCSENNYTKLR